MTRRWVRYELPVMVCVDVDDDTDHADIARIVLGIETDDIKLARDRDGPLVYDEQMERVGGGADAAAIRAVSLTEDRTAWPPADEYDWEEGPDPLRYPELYDEDDPAEEPELAEPDDEYDPLELREPSASSRG